jgi:hypothetical protein
MGGECTGSDITEGDRPMSLDVDELQVEVRDFPRLLGLIRAHASNIGRRLDHHERRRHFTINQISHKQRK